jgi:hypothetical protein
VRDDGRNPGERTMGSDIPVVNTSAEASGGTVNNYTRPAQSRDASGRYRRRGVTLIGGLDSPERTKLGRDSVTGQMVRVRDLSVDGPVHYLSPDWGRGDARTSHEGSAEVHAAVNHLLACPCHTTGGACQ